MIGYYRLTSVFLTILGIFTVLSLIWLGLSFVDVNHTMMTALFALGIGLMVMCFNAESDHRIQHITRILKKNGIWTDEWIKRKDLPKTNIDKSNQPQDK